MRLAILISVISMLPTAAWSTSVEVKSLADLKDQTIKLAINPFFDKYSESERTASFTTHQCRVQVSGLNGFAEYRDMTLSNEATTWVVGDYHPGNFVVLDSVALKSSDGARTMTVSSLDHGKKDQGVFDCLASSGFEVPQTVDRPSSAEVVSGEGAPSSFATN